MLDRGLDECGAKPLACDQRPARLAARRQRLAHHRGSQRRGALARLDVQRRQQQGMHQPVVQRAGAIDDIGDRSIGLDPQQPPEPEILGEARARDTAALVENPPRQPVADSKPPALVGGEIDERKLRRLRPHQARGAADCLRELHDRVVARQHQVVAVVDGHPDGAVEVRPAAAARIGGGFVHDDLRRRRRQLHRRCKARQACADNVDGSRHQMIAYWTAIQDSRSGLTLTRVRGASQPRAIMPCSMTR